MDHLDPRPARFGLLTSSAPFPPLAWAGSVLMLLSIPGLAALFSGGTAPALLDFVYDAAILAAVNAPAVVWTLRAMSLPFALRAIAAVGMLLLAVLLVFGLPTAEHYGAWGFPAVLGLLILALVCVIPSPRHAIGPASGPRTATSAPTSS